MHIRRPKCALPRYYWLFGSIAAAGNTAGNQRPKLWVFRAPPKAISFAHLARLKIVKIFHARSPGRGRRLFLRHHAKAYQVSSNPLPTWKTPSSATSPITTGTQGHSPGQKPRTRSSKSSPASLYLLNESAHLRPDPFAPLGIVMEPPRRECLRPSHPAYSSHSSTQWLVDKPLLTNFNNLLNRA